MALSRPATMKRTSALLLFLLLGLAVAFVGCDTESDDTPDVDRIVGTWTATQANIEVDSGTPLGSISVPVLSASDEGEIEIVFDVDGGFTLTVTGPITAEFFTEEVVIVEDGFSETISGSYDIVSDRQIRFGVEDAPDAAVNIDYDFDGDDEFDLSVENTEEGRAALAFLLEDQVPQEVIDAVEGGSITFERNL